MEGIGAVFPGQGAQYVGMGRDIYLGSETAREIFRRAEEVLGFEISRLCFEGPARDLTSTSNAQPAIFLVSIATMAVLLERGLSFSMVAGLSLGEYTALVASGAISFEDGLILTRARGRLMEEASKKRPGIMASIIGLSQSHVEEICEEARRKGVVQVANINCPGQVVISGEEEAVREAMRLSGLVGAKRTVVLEVSGPFHSSLMEEAASGLEEVLSGIRIERPKIPFYSNVTGEKAWDGEEIKRLLVKQMTSPVLWEATVRNMIRDGARAFLEIGPGRVLTGLIKRIDRRVLCANAEDLQGVEEAMAYLMKGGFGSGEA
jgi:[acyl-carrier-protein] S-malonyltransferase